MEIPYGSALGNDLFIRLNQSDACQKMKDVFPNLVHMKQETCKIYDWVSPCAAIHCFTDLIHDSSSLPISWKMIMI